jgi:hypothetical protein
MVGKMHGEGRRHNESTFNNLINDGWEGTEEEKDDEYC